MEGGGFGAVVVCVVVVSIVALVLAMVDAGRIVYRGGAVVTGEFLIWLFPSLSSFDSLADSSDGTFSGSSKGGKFSSTGDGSLVSLRTSSKS